MSDNNRTLVSVDENADVSRTLRTWLNGYPNKPLSKLEFEWLGDYSGLCLSTIQATYKTKQFIDGTYQAQYQFKIVYRLTATTANERFFIRRQLSHNHARMSLYLPPELV